MCHKGQSLMEYGIALCTVVMLSIVGLMSLSSNINIALSSMIPKYVAGQAANVSRVPKLLANIPIQQALYTQNSTSTNSHATGQLSGESHSISTSDTQKSIAVSGANGATRELASILTSTVEQALATGEITQAQAQVLLELANQGYALAEIEKLLEDAVAQGKTEVTFKNKRYQTWELAQQLGLNVPENTWNLDSQYAAALMAPFLKQYKAVEQAGALTDPALKNMVSQLSYQIAAIGDAVSWQFGQWQTQGKPAITTVIMNTQTANLFQMDMQGTPYSDATHTASGKTNQNSNQICTIGGVSNKCRDFP